MAEGDGPILTKRQLRTTKIGIPHSVPILSEDEVVHYVPKLKRPAGPWRSRNEAGWSSPLFPLGLELSTHPRLLNCLEQLLALTSCSNRPGCFYKYGRSVLMSGGIRMASPKHWEDGRAPAFWLGLTAAL